MDRKETTIVKHALKKAVVALRIVFIPAFLLCGRGTLMSVQAVCETPAQMENTAEETQPESEAEEAVQLQAESAEEETAAQAETVEEEVPVQTETAGEEMPAQEEAAEEETQTQEESAEEIRSVTMVGDSVMLGASPFILGMMPDCDCVIDAKVSRQVTQADSVLDSLEQQDSLRQTVVIALGTNGSFSTERGQEIIDRLGSGRTIYWVTVYGRDLVWQEESNATIRKLAEDNENVHIIDWTQAVSGHAEWLCSDGIHLSAEGREAYARVILEGLSYY